MYETIRIVDKLKPKYVLWENVKNLLSKKHIHNFRNYVDIMSEGGYNSYYKVLNAKDYGIPQNRERVFTISIRQDIDNGTFQFPKPFELKLKLKDMLEDEVDEKYFLSDKMINYIKADNDKWTGNNGESLINKEIASTINTGEGQKRCDASNYISDMLPANYNIKQQLCDYLIENNKVKENDVIRHSYSTSRLKEWKRRNIETNNISPILDTRSDCLGVVVKKVGHIPQWHQRGGIYDSEGISPTLCSTDYKTPKLASIKIKNNTKQGYLEAESGDGINISSRMHHQRGNVQKEMIQTLDTQADKGVVLNDLRIRKLTPKECWRLMGFDDADFDKAEKVNSNAQLYKQAGNSIVVNVLEKILENLFLKEENDFEGQISFDMLGD